MKKLLYFLIGFTLAFVPVHIVYASCSVDGAIAFGSYPSITYGNNTLYSIVDNATTRNEHTEDVKDLFHPTYITSSLVHLNNSGYWIMLSEMTGLSTLCFDGAGLTGARINHPDGTTKIWVVLWPSMSIIPPDSDGDGYPDDCDLYPNDPRPASYKVETSMKHDDTGEIVGYVISTDRGDYMDLGSIMQNSTNGSPNPGYSLYRENNSPWRSNDDLCSGSPVGSGTGNQDIDQLLDNTPPPEPPEVPKPVSGEGQDNHTEADPTTGLEATELEALQKIINNTYITNNNIGNLADYLDAMNTAINHLDSNNENRSSNLETVLHNIMNQQLEQSQTHHDDVVLTMDEINTNINDLETALTTAINEQGPNLSPAALETAIGNALSGIDFGSGGTTGGLTAGEVQSAVFAAIASSNLTPITEAATRVAVSNALMDRGMEAGVIKTKIVEALTEAGLGDGSLPSQAELDSSLSDASDPNLPDGQTWTDLDNLISGLPSSYTDLSVDHLYTDPDDNIDSDFKTWTQQKFNDTMDYMLANNPVTAILNVEDVLEISGSSSCFDAQVLGSTINFCFDKYHAVLQAFGSLLVAIASLYGFMSIVRRN